MADFLKTIKASQYYVQAWGSVEHNVISMLDSFNDLEYDTMLTVIVTEKNPDGSFKMHSVSTTAISSDPRTEIEQIDIEHGTAGIESITINRRK